MKPGFSAKPKVVWPRLITLQRHQDPLSDATWTPRSGKRSIAYGMSWRITAPVSPPRPPPA